MTTGTEPAAQAQPTPSAAAPSSSDGSAAAERRGERRGGRRSGRRPERRFWIGVGAGVAAAAVVGGILAAVLAGTGGAVAAPPSDGPIHLWDPASEQLAEQAGAVFDYDRGLDFAASATDPREPFVCPAESTATWTFVSRHGAERAGITGWKAYSASGFDPEPSVPGRLEVLLPVAALDYQSDGSPADAAQLRADGGTWSFGLACTADEGRTVTAAYTRTIHVTPGTGEFTVDPVDGD
ncbi:hypothetical protein ACDF64_06895 [Agromyces sp. MMS24-JH15]|uniref:hypothetical protein n=1 Tax=Agromyces sp. MMS24-JH15 TaxID=3243765 RepID=UPI0037480B8C